MWAEKLEKVETKETTNEKKVVNEIQDADPKSVAVAVEKNGSLKNAKEASPGPKPAPEKIWEKTLQAIKKEFSTLASQTDENINNFALKNKISPNTIRAFLYTENNADIQKNIATEDKNNPKNTNINTQTMWRFYKEYAQNGKIETNAMTWIVLDFTGSMSLQQITAMITTLQDLYQKWLITPTTKCNVMFDVPDMEGQNRTINNINDTQQKIMSIEYWINGDSLKTYLKQVKLMNENNEIISKWKWSTPLYETILESLMNDTVKDANIFTDWSSDASATKPVWFEEIGNKESWDAMIHLCKTYNKKINIVAFNMKPEYLTRTQNMQTYFESKWASRYINIINLWDKKDEQLSSELTKTILNNNEITIQEAENMKNGKTLTITTNISKNNTYNIPNTESTLPELHPTESAVYDATNNTYKINIGKIFPGVDLSQYNINYTIYSTASIDIKDKYLGNPDGQAYLFDVSNSMNTINKNLWVSDQFFNSDLSYTNLLKVIKNTKWTNKEINNKNADINIKQIVSDTKININTKDPWYRNILEKAMKRYFPDQIIDTKTSWVDDAEKKLKNNGKLDEVHDMYMYIKWLDTPKSENFTPILETIDQFAGDITEWSTGANERITFLEWYAWKQVNIVTDFIENASSSSGLKQIYTMEKGKDKESLINEYIDKMINNAEKYGFSLNFKYPKDKVDQGVLGFVKDIGNKINQKRTSINKEKERTNNPIFTFEEINPNNQQNRLGLKYQRTYDKWDSKYIRKYISLSLAPKNWTWEKITRNIAIQNN